MELMTYIYGDETHDTCEDCGGLTEIVPAEQVTDPAFFIRAAEMDLEDANHHSITHVPSALYDEIAEYCVDDDLTTSQMKLKIAMAIYNAFRNL